MGTCGKRTPPRSSLGGRVAKPGSGDKHQSNAGRAPERLPRLGGRSGNVSGDRPVMLPKKRKYVPHCPSRTCSGGHEHMLHHFDLFRAMRLGLIPTNVAELRRGETAYRCSYCGLIWFQRSRKIGLDPFVVGYYDSPRHPGFRPLGPHFQRRHENLA